MTEGNTRSTLVAVGVIAFLVGRYSAASEPVAASSTSVIAAGEEAPAFAQPLPSQADPEPTPPIRSKAAETTVNPSMSDPSTGSAGKIRDEIDDLADEPDPVPDPESVNDPDEVVYHQNCAAVRAAGAAPLNASEPGYAPKLDRDRDAVACE